MNKTRIDWGIPNLLTWNPVTGCERKCPWCYARKIHERFHKNAFDEIQYHPERMDDLERLGNRKEPFTIFVGSMSDIEYWPQHIIQHILNEILYYQKHTFIFLSKNPLSYKGFIWPQNTIQGLTITGEETEYKQYYLLSEMLTNYNRVLISIEPLLGTVKMNIKDNAIEKIVVGALTGGRKAIQPSNESIGSVYKYCDVRKVYWKKTINMRH